MKKSLLFVCLIFLPLSIHGQIENEDADYRYGMQLYKDGLFELAETQYQRFLDQYPVSPHAFNAQFLMGEAFFELEDYSSAQDAYLRLLLKYPASQREGEARYRIAECFEKSGQYTQAVTSYFSIYTHQKDEWGRRGALRSARLSFEKEDYTRAESVCRTLLETTPRGEYRIKTALLLGKILQVQNRSEEAISLLRSLQPISEPTDRFAILLQLGDLCEKLGYWRESLQHVDQALTLQTDVDQQVALMRKGVLHEVLNEYESAEHAFQESALGSNPLFAYQAYMHLGQIRVSMGQGNAEEAFRLAAGQASDPEAQFKAMQGQAASLSQSQRYDEARNIYDHLLMGMPPASDIFKESLLIHAHISIRDQAETRALIDYNRFIELYPTDFLAPFVMLAKGRILIESFQRYDEGFMTLHSLWQDFPLHPAAPAARFAFARGLEAVDRSVEAAQVYRAIIQEYVASEWSEMALERSQWIRDMHSNDNMLIQVLDQVGKGGNPADFQYRAGLALYHMKNYQRAVEFFSNAVENTLQATRQDSALYFMGCSHAQVYRKKGAQESRQQAESFFRRILNERSDAAVAADAGLQLARLYTLDTPDEAYGIYRELMTRYQTADAYPEILYRCGTTAMTLDFLQHGLECFNDLRLRYPENSFSQDALYQSATAYFLSGELAPADSLFQRYTESEKTGVYHAPSLYYLARIAGAGGQLREAGRIYQDLLIRHPHASWADSCLLHYGKILLETGEFREAQTLFENAVARAEHYDFAASAGLWKSNDPSRRKKLLLGLASAYEGLQSYKQAKETYLEYAHSFRADHDQVVAYAALARIAEAENRPARAVEYLTNLQETWASDSTAMEIGLLQMRLNQYDEAIQSFETANRLSASEESKEFASQKIILSLLKQGKIPQAEVRINVFEQSFKNRPDFKSAMAEFLLEKGRAYIVKKDFEPALEVLREVTRRYRDTDFRPEAEFETGRIYLITNRTDDALELLTEMPERYPNHPVLAKVYLNLGDHYFQNRQYDNAVHAFRTAIADDRTPEVTPLAMRYLIRVYDSIRMWDSALFLTREYIKQYPHAQDIMQKRVQIGSFYMKLKEYSRAIEYFRDIKNNADAETEAEIQYWIADSYFNMGQFEQAIFEFLKVEYLSQHTKLPWNTTAVYQAGKSYLKLNRPGQAKKLFQKIVNKEGATSDLGRIARQEIDKIEASTSAEE